MAEKIIIIGCGEHAAVVAEAIMVQPERWKILGFVDSRKNNQESKLLNIRKLGYDDDLPKLIDQYPNAKFLCGIGNNKIREKVVTNSCIEKGQWAVVIHPEASVSSSNLIAEGTVVLRRAIIQPGVTIGKHCIINSGTIVEHDSMIGDFAHVAPGVVGGGGVIIGDGTFVGLGSRIRDHITIGKGVTVGTGAVVVQDVIDGETVIGVPARPIDFTQCDIDVNALCISPDSTLYDAMSLIARCGVAALVTDPDMRLLGLLNDADIRRVLLNHMDFNTPVHKIMNTDFRSVRKNIPRSAALQQLKAYGHRIMPILDEDDKVVGLHLIDAMIASSNVSNIAVIMAGGKGVRLRPLTENLPKPMVRVAGRPILEHIVLHLAEAGIRNIYIAVNYLGEVIEEYFKDGSKHGVKIHYLREKTPLGTGGALKLLPEIPTEPIIVMNGDLVTQFDVERILHYHQQGNYNMTIGARDYRVDIPYGVIEWNEDKNSVATIREKPDEHFIVNSGIYVIDPELIELIEPDRNMPITELLDKVLEKKMRVGAHLVEGDWVDVGQHKELATARGL